MNLLRSLRNLLTRRREDDEQYYGQNGAYNEYDDDLSPNENSAGGERQLYTALDIGTAYAKAIIVEVHKDYAEVLGVGRHAQSYSHMSDGFVTDISGVIANCNEALIKAEQAAGGIVAPSTVIGIAGELVKGSSTTVSKQRQKPLQPITPEELETMIASAQQKLLKSARERIAAETGYANIDVRLTNAAVIAVRIDGQVVSNPIGFRGRYFELTVFSAFAPLAQLGALETVAQGLDLTLVTIVAEPYALARCLSANASADSGAIFIDIGGGTTDIALVRHGGIEETRMFALGGRTFTRRIATSKGISLKDAERLKIGYSKGEIKGSGHDEIQAILAPECQTWMDSVELLIEELAKEELLPPAIYTVGGGSALKDIQETLEKFPWTERLPFSRRPIIRTVLPEMVSSIIDEEGLLSDAQDITPMALAYQAIELQNENSVLERALDRVINTMHI
jgi:cell division protein FtsA